MVMRTSLFAGKWATRVGAGLWLTTTLLQGGSVGRAQDANPNLPAGLQDIVKLVKAGLNEEVVLAQIKHVGAAYTLSADQIIFLHNQGVTQNEITALLGTSGNSAPSSQAPPSPAPAAVANPAPSPYPAASGAPVPGTSPAPQQVAPVPAAPTMPPPASDPVSLQGFQAQLAPYGTWTDVPGYGLCWRPSVEAGDPFWRPYCDQGHWVYTDDGWTWQSDYPWGNISFHYGRWYRDSLGWVWVPGYDWAPAWVCWRQTDGYCGWAPLPPGAIYRVGVGLWYHGRVAVDVDFGLGPDDFTFVAYDHFWDYNLHAFLLPRERLRLVFGRTVIMNGYRFDHGRFIVEGIGRERMAALTHHEIRVEDRLHDAERRDHELDRARDARRDRRDDRR